MIPLSLQNKLDSYFAANPLDAHHKDLREKLPYDIGAAAAQVDRYLRADNFKIVQPGDNGLIEEVRSNIDATLPNRAERRNSEQLLADYIDGVGESHDPHGMYKLNDLSESLRNCRLNGAVGIRPGGGYVVAWDNKCSESRLCPDEAREETQRLVEKYHPAVMEWRNKKPGIRRIFYAVFTEHNYRVNSLEAGKKAQLERFKEIMNGKIDACPVEFHHRRPLVSRKRKLPRFPGLKGSLVIQEDPLSASDDWNIHLNAFLLWEGPCDWAQIRQEWGSNIHIAEIKPEDLTKALLEAIKYSAQIVPTKSAEKKAKHETEAPAMIEWPPLRWLEWWRAQKGFRRTRSYGRLYRIDPVESDAVEMDMVQWVGSISYTGEHGAGSYRVDLIPGDNFSGSGRSSNKKNRFGLDENPEYRPPPDPPSGIWTR